MSQTRVEVKGHSKNLDPITNGAVIRLVDPSRPDLT